jgi:hypothetical protein
VRTLKEEAEAAKEQNIRASTRQIDDLTLQLHVCMYVYVCMYVCMYVCTYACTYEWMYLFILYEPVCAYMNQSYLHQYLCITDITS